MKTITENELNAMGRKPRKIRISMKDGKKQVHFFTDEEILELVKNGTVSIGPDAEWIDVIKE